jgi:polysaccharide pyruvyl transferase WcaK-like protein
MTKSYRDVTVTEVDSVPIASLEGQAQVAVRCSMILPAGSDSARLYAYLLRLSRAELRQDYELIIVNNCGLNIHERQLSTSLPRLKVLNADHVLDQDQSFDRAVMAASGRFVLIIRNFIDFDKVVLEESVNDLENSQDKLSVSANGNFVLVERLHYACIGGFAGLLNRLEPGAKRVGRRSYQNLSTSKGTVLLVVCLFEDNFGDILIYETADRKLRQAGFETRAVEVSQSLDKSKLIERANNSDFLYFVGGGLIERSAPQIIRHFDSLYKHIRVPYGVVGLGTGAFDYTAFNNSLRLFSENAAFFYTRDEESVETFSRAGTRRPPIAGVDIAFANDTLARLESTGDIVTACFRNVPYVDVTGDLNWSMWSEALRKIGVESLICDCSNAQEKLGIPIDNSNILGQILKSKIIVAMRFHIILAAAMTGVLTIPINYCPKVKRLARQLGIEDYCLELNDHDQLESRLRRLKSNEKTVRSNLQARVTELKSSASQIIQSSIRKMEEHINER